MLAAAASAQEDGQSFKDWTVRCDANAVQQVQGGCLITQFVINKENNQPVMQIQVAYAPQAADPTLVIILPLGVLLNVGVAIQVDQNAAVNRPYGWCLADGCRVRMPLDQGQLALFKAGNAGSVAFKVLGGSDQALPFSLNGFTAALAALK